MGTSCFRREVQRVQIIRIFRHHLLPDNRGRRRRKARKHSEMPPTTLMECTGFWITSLLLFFSQERQTILNMYKISGRTRFERRSPNPSKRMEQSSYDHRCFVITATRWHRLCFDGPDFESTCERRVVLSRYRSFQVDLQGKTRPFHPYRGLESLETIDSIWFDYLRRKGVWAVPK